MCIIWITEARHQDTSACFPLAQPAVTGSFMFPKQLGASVSVWGLLLHFHRCAYAVVVGFAHLIRLADGKTESSKKLFALLPRHHPSASACVFAGASLSLGRFSSVPGVSLNPGLLKDSISPYCSVFRQVSDTQTQGRTKDMFKASRSLLGRMVLGFKYCPWKLWSGICCA